MTALPDIDAYDIFDIRSTFSLTEMSAKLLHLLMTHKAVTNEMVNEKLGLKNKAHALKFRLNQSMERYNVSIALMWGEGYYLKPDQKARILQLLNEERTRTRPDTAA